MHNEVFLPACSAPRGLQPLWFQPRDRAPQRFPRSGDFVGIRENMLYPPRGLGLWLDGHHNRQPCASGPLVPEMLMEAKRRASRLQDIGLGQHEPLCTFKDAMMHLHAAADVLAKASQLREDYCSPSRQSAQRNAERMPRLLDHWRRPEHRLQGIETCGGKPQRTPRSPSLPDGLATPRPPRSAMPRPRSERALGVRGSRFSESAHGLGRRMRRLGRQTASGRAHVHVAWRREADQKSLPARVSAPPYRHLLHCVCVCVCPNPRVRCVAFCGSPRSRSRGGGSDKSVPKALSPSTPLSFV